MAFRQAYSVFYLTLFGTRSNPTICHRASEVIFYRNTLFLITTWLLLKERRKM